MFHNRRLLFILSSAAGLLIAGAVALMSQSAGRRSPALIHETVDESKLVTLAGNTRPEVTAENDLGVVSDGFSLPHMTLQLKRSPQQEQAVVQFIAELHDPQSPNFHKWLTAEEFGVNYGVAESDVRTITNWLESHGFTVNSVYPNGMLIDFSGNAGQVRRAFHTSIHSLVVGGVRHFANVSDPRIPESLAPAVAGVMALHDFRPHKMSHPKYTVTSFGQTQQAVVPPDLATIYDFNPLFSKGITGSGQTVVVIEDSDLYSRADWVTFRTTFGLSTFTSGALTSQHPAPPSGANNCTPPGINGDDSEAILDAEWASAAAPGAAIVVAACAEGPLTAMQNLVNGTSPPAIISNSYGGCEPESGVTQNAYTNSLYQQAVAEGISVFVAAGDEGAAECDAGQPYATHGITVDGSASTPYNVAVGGTDFADVLTSTTATYWGKTNTKTFGSALSYIPEIPWNNSCASPLLATYMGYATSYGAAGFCNSNAAITGGFVAVSAGSGGPSNCATGVPATAGVANGTCAGYAKPSWQTGFPGNPPDGVRDLPDVSMFASDNPVWGHYSVVCFSDVSNSGTPCTGAPSGWAGFGGTSVAAPVMAGIQALVNQNMGARQGNPNPVYYALAASKPSTFHRITQGDIEVSCAGPRNCFGIVGTVDYGRGGRIYNTTSGGALSVSSATFAPAYATGGAWSFATGLGSVDANNLVTNWPKTP